MGAKIVYDEIGKKGSTQKAKEASQMEGFCRVGLMMVGLLIAIIGFSWITQVLADFAVKLAGG